MLDSHHKALFSENFHLFIFFRPAKIQHPVCLHKKNCSPTHVGEQPQHKHKIKHDKTTMQSAPFHSFSRNGCTYVYSHTHKCFKCAASI
ncbi:hypothetical protein DW921_05375 [Phocaeicola coprophilus]|uniref:Uncharacterized protein n=1 Tax=Phocaeicola coprophilus TaxID=387090 RepID=A0A413T1U0_9BACT|nr:hypothetical protein DW921_05375 [Phocaeicola coprophilus]